MKTAAERITIDRHFYRSDATSRYVLQPGMRIWANGLGLRFDPYRSCPNQCQYCAARSFADAMSQRSTGVHSDPRVCRPANLATTKRQFRTVFEEGKLRPYDWATWALSKRFFVEVGCMGEPMQAPDLDRRVTWNFLTLLQRYNVPLYLNTKGNLLVADESYYRHLLDVPVKVVDVSLAGTDDGILRKIDAKAPLASERLALMARLKRDGVPVVASVRPIIKGISDADWEGFIQRLVDIGVDSIHIRTLIITGKLLRVPKWRRHAEEHMQRSPGGWRYPKEYMMDLFWRAMLVCEGTGTAVVGTRRHWFDLGGFHGKAAFDRMPAEVQERLFPYTIVPILRTVREREDEPQLLTWGDLGYHDVDIPTLHLGGGLRDKQDALIHNTAYTVNYRKRYLITGSDYVRLGLWDGFVPMEKRPAGELVGVERIYPVVYEDGRTVFDTAENSVLAYIPPAQTDRLVSEYGGSRRAAVLLDNAEKLLTPERAKE